MSAKAADNEYRLDSLKWLLVAVLVGVGIAGNIYFDDQSLLYRIVGLIILGGAAAFIAVQTQKGAAFWQLVKEARTEIRRVVWPSRQESTQTTLIVVAFVIVTALILWGLDTLLGWLASIIIG